MKDMKQSDVAIVGMSCHFPGANDYASYWQNLVAKKNSIQEVPADRWCISTHYSPEKNQINKSISKWCGLIEDIKSFDNEFFNISPIEARNMDPQQRLLLQESWHCIEDSAIPLSTLQKAKTAVFAGAMTSDYLLTLNKSEDTTNRFSILGNDHCILANRISHQLNLSGESISINAASASSLVAIHKAKSALVLGECDYAIAAGVNLNTDPFKYIVFSQAGMLSPDGQCKSFSDDANGYVPGDGVAALLLQPLQQAIENNHHIYGVIKGSAINHIGSGKTITAPCADAQAAVIRDALKNADRSIADVGYIEAHGSGTPLGDPIEVAAISRVFKDTQSDVIIGTVKPNIGHLEAAAGIAGVIKALHVLKQQYIPANLNLNKVNPVINLKQAKLKLASGEYLNTHDKPCVGVSSFGFGGVSCHLILEKYQPPQSIQKPVVLENTAAHFVLSAKSKFSLEQNIQNWQQYLQSSQSSQDYIHDICASMTSGREQFPYRVGFLAASKDQLFSQLQHHKITNQQLLHVTSFVFADSRESVLKHNIPLIDKHYQQLFKRVESSTQYDVQKSSNVFRRTDFKSTLLSVAVFNALQELHMFPSLVEQLEQGVWAALLAVESVSLDDYLAVVLHNQKPNDVVFYHPKFPLKISPSSPTIYPQYINRNFMQQFFNEVKSQHHSYQNIIDQTSVLLVEDENFIDLISVWNYSNENQGDLFDTLRNFSEVLVEDVQKAAYALVAANVSLNRFYQKWQIECGNSQDTYYISLMSDLIAKKVLSHSVFYQISQKQSKAIEDILLTLNRRHWRTINQLVDAAKKHQHKLPIRNKSNLVAAIKQKVVNLSKNTMKIPRVAIGRLAVKLKDSIDVEISDVQQWQQTLLAYWLQGNEVNWNKLYPPGSFQATPLPGYVFEKVNFSSREKLPVNPTKQLPEQLTENPPELTLPDTKTFKSDTENHSGVAPIQLAKTVTILFAKQLSLDSHQIDLKKNLEAFGLDSMAYTAMSEQINQKFATKLTPACFYGYKNVQQLIDEVAQQVPSAGLNSKQVKSKSQQVHSQQSKQEHVESTSKKILNLPVEDIAIIGYAGQLPHADTLEQFWSNLMDGVDGITEIPANRWRWQNYFSNDIKAANKSNSKWGGFISDIDCFDAAFFGISPQEAKLMDPQQRLLLQTVWHAVEQAGQQPAALAGSDTGVFIGASTSDYEELIRAHDLAAHASTGMNRSIIANRISFVLDLLGPSEVVDTACSSSLVAIHKAVQAIKSGACQIALAGGVNALVTPTHYISYGKAGMLSPDGRCKTFDKDANGYVRAEGVGVVVLKSLSQAIKDHDLIHAVIKASGTNHGGKASSLTAPNPKAQAQLIIDTYQKAGINSHSIDYIENHGTGTPLGDPIEINGLNLAFEQLAVKENSGQRKQPCHLASVKSNIGHLEAAAGIAGTLKVLFALKHEYLPASQHIKTLNPFIKNDKNLFNVLQQNTPWPSQPEHRLRRAGISSFGFGGVNAHIVLEEYPHSVSPVVRNSPEQPKSIVLISAKTGQALDEYAQKYMDYFSASDQSVAIQQVAYTSQTGRNHENHRLAICAHSIQELIDGLRDFIDQEKSTNYFYAQIEADNDHSVFVDKLMALWQKGSSATLAKLWVKGAGIEWHSFYANQTVQRVVLPVYPFAKKSHWLHASTEPVNGHQTKSTDANGELQTTHYHKISKQHYLATEHVVDNVSILPGVFSLVLLYTALAKAGIAAHDVVFKDVLWQAPMQCKDSKLLLQVTSQTKKQGRQFQVTNIVEPSAQVTTFTQATCLESRTNSRPNEQVDFKLFKALQAKDYYAQLTQVGFAYGPHFRVIKQVICHQQYYLAKLELDKNLHSEDEFLFDPRLLDGALQMCLIALIDQGLLQPTNDWSYVPMMIEEIQVLRQLPATVFALVQASPAQQEHQQSYAFNIQLLDSQKQLCVSIKQVVFKQFPRSKNLSKQALNTAQSLKLNGAVNSTNQQYIQDMPTETEANYFQGNRAVNTQALRQKTSAYFIQQIAETAELETNEINVKQSFKEYGIDSFLTLRIIRNLEEDFGDLRKTLMFEASNINQLVDIFISEHQDTLLSIFGMETAATQQQVDQQLVVNKPPIEIELESDLSHFFNDDIDSDTSVKGDLTVSVSHTIIKDDSLDQEPDLAETVQQLFAQFGGESIALSRKDIAPYIFLCNRQLGLFYFNTHKNLLLAFRYVGPEDYFLEAVSELKIYCQAQQLEMNVLSEVKLQNMQQQGLVANSFGVVQRLPDISNFSLKGGKMRRLRYQINKFIQSGHAETTEYKSGSEVAKDDAVANMIEKWASIKSGVNPYIWRVKDDMETGCLGAEYRVFLTYLDHSLQNVVIVSKIESDNSYLLDTEFYSNEMAMGAMEYSIHEIIKKIRQEGCEAFSLGLTFGASFKDSPQADPAVSKAFEKLAEDGIFEESGNHQFKNKFRSENAGLYLYRTQGQTASNVLDIIMMIGNPHSVRPATPVQLIDHAAATSTQPLMTQPIRAHQPSSKDSKVAAVSATQVAAQPIKQQTGSDIDRLNTIQQAGFNPFNLDRADIEFDLATDSWSELEYPFIKARTQLLQSKAQNNQQSLEEAISEVFGLPHVLPFSAGRVAESFFCPAWPKGKKHVIQNLLFPTCLFHQVNNDFIPVEVVDKEFHNRQSKHIFKGNMEIEALQAKLQEHLDDVAFVWVELADNAAGGCSVSISNLKDIKACIGDIPLVIDATRIIENAYHIAAYEEPFIGQDIWSIVDEICSYADVINASLTKDFGTHCGGFIATRDADLCAQIQDSISTNGSGISRTDRQLITQAVKDKPFILESVKLRMEAVLQLAQHLLDHGLTVVQPVGGHCVLIDPMVIDELSTLNTPLPAFLAWLYQQTGIRAGIHSVGRQRNTSMNNLIRLAVPVGLIGAPIKIIGDRLVKLFNSNSSINDLTMKNKPQGLFGEMKANYTVKQQVQLQLSNRQMESPSKPTDNQYSVTENSKQVNHTALEQGNDTTSNSVRMNNQQSSNADSNPIQDIAVIGMSGRYPDANNLDQFWDNLCGGKNSIKLGPNWASRFVDPITPQHLGGFIDDVDKFDSLFFSISPREAQNMDPQERMVMEVSWEALEDAGYHPESLIDTIGSQQIGVFVGAVWSYYEMLGAENRQLGGRSHANSQHWGISNRISSFMNFCGPSLTVDTACSSSLTAIHLACESLRHGECQVALAGGVNLDLHPSKHHITQAAQFLSEEGLCRAFGQGGSGYVAGEGVGTLVLKPLEQAEQDGDHIYGVIKSTVTNHGGRTAGYTVPSPNAQADLIAAAIAKANISAATIGYMEAHGTGTELGDPVEIQGATKAYRHDTPAKQYCSIGSVKTNIGHLEAAAGIAGATKLLLQIKHKQLVPSLHSKVLNEHIDFKNSPFYVQQNKDYWQPLEAAGKMQPRRAGLSSFGAGGTNVHIIFEEHARNQSNKQADHSPDPQLIVLSARKDQQLQIQASQLLDWLEHSQNKDVDLRDVAYTLQVGRLPMGKRMAILADDKSTLINGLKDFVNNKSNQSVWLADSSTKLALDLFDGDESEQIIELLINHGSYHKMARLWVNGVDINWLKTSRRHRQKISLPTYPFAKESHWIEPVFSENNTTSEQQVKTQPTQLPISSEKTIHPLIDENLSVADHLEYRKQFNLNQFVFRDHIVDGLPTLPGVAYMEMAIATVQLAFGTQITTMKNLIWASPINSQCSNDIRIQLNNIGDVANYEICTFDAAGKKHVHSQGKAELMTKPKAVLPAKDIHAIKKRCSGYQSKAACYDLLATRKLNYGEPLQSIDGFHCGNKEGLTVLKLPDSLLSSFNDYQAHPSMLDGAVQSIISLLEYTNTLTQPGVPYVPFVLSELVIHKPLTQSGYAHLTLDEGKKERDDIKKISIDIMDETGEILLQMKDFSFKAISDQTIENSHTAINPLQSLNQADVMLYQPTWVPKELISQDRMKHPDSDIETVVLFDNLPNNKQALIEALNVKLAAVILVDPGDVFLKKDKFHYQLDPTDAEHLQKFIDAILADSLSPNRFIHNLSSDAFLPEQFAIENDLKNGLYSVFMLSQVLLKNSKAIGSKSLGLTYLYHSQEKLSQPSYGAVSAFFRSIKHEGANIDVKSICISHHPEESSHAINWPAIVQEMDHKGDIEVMYQSDKRLCRQSSVVIADDHIAIKPSIELAKSEGVYLITGGAGGLGLLFAKELLKTTGVQIILTGRSATNDDNRAKIEQLHGQVEYLSCDLTHAQEVVQLITKITAQYGRLDGVIHAAGIIKDGFLWNKELSQFAAVLAAKIMGSQHLDQATKDLDLDYFIMCSSIASTIGNMGQSDYAAGNRFMDDFAVLRAQWHRDGSRKGQSISINWPLWKSGGMQVNEQAEQWLFDNWGMQPLETQVGMDALKFAVTAQMPIFGLVQGDTQKIQQVLSIEVVEGSRESAKPVQSIQKAAAAMVISDSSLSTQSVHRKSQSVIEYLQQDLTDMVVALLKIKASDIEFSDNMSTYGFDSVTFTEFANLINKELEIDVTPLIFFEQETLSELTTYLLEEFADDLDEHYVKLSQTNESLVEIESPVETDSVKETESVAESTQDLLKSITDQRQDNNPEYQPSTADDSQPKHKDIAIIGMSGVMPQSADLDVFWQNLLDEKNLITEIPKDRWDWQKFYGESDLGNSKTEIKWGGFIPEVDKFDASFFNISPLEAELTDPQQRLFLETVWHTVEDAGYQASALSGTNTGVFVGIGTSDYHELLREQNSDFEAYSVMGWMHAVLANRISYFFNWSGPSEPIGTACSSSLVAIDRAVQAIRSGQCDQCIAGGISLILNPGLHIGLDKAAMLSPDGQCKTFDHRANGYVRSEGVGALLLKSLSQAKADGDHIYAIIKGSAVNHGGHVNTFTTPNPKAQTAVMSMAYDDAGIDPATLTYIEAHGTGTALGDPIEIQGLLKAFKNKANHTKTVHNHKEYCALGSVKTNVGHLELAAGMAGMFKLILSLKNKTIPASINFEQVNPYIKLNDTPFRLATSTQSWQQISDIKGDLIPRRAGISSFGFGGVNAHLILEEFEQPQTHAVQAADDKGQVITFSTKYEAGLPAYAQQLLSFINSRLANDSLPALCELAAGFQQGREGMPKKLALVVSDYADLVEKLTQYCAGHSVIGIFHNVGDQTANAAIDDHGIDAMMAQCDLTGLAELWVLGVKIDWEKLNPRSSKIPLPRYPFQKNRYWLLDPNYTGAIFSDEDGEKFIQSDLGAVGETTDELPVDKGQQSAVELTSLTVQGIHMELTQQTDKTYLFKFLVEENCCYLDDHDIAGMAIMPAAVYLELVNQAVVHINGKRAVGFLDVEWVGALFKGASQSGLMLKLSRNNTSFDFSFYSSAESDSSQQFCQGTVSTQVNDFTVKDELFDVSTLSHGSLNHEDTYELFKSHGFVYGKSLAAIKALKTGADQCSAQLSLPSQFVERLNDHCLYSALIDGALQSMLGVLLFDNKDSVLKVPVSVTAIEWLKPLTADCFVQVMANQANLDAAQNDHALFEVKIYDQQKQLALVFSDLAIRPLQPRNDAVVHEVQIETSSGTPSTDYLMGHTVKFLAQMIADETKRDRSTIHADSHFDGFGIDSFLAMRMTKKLEKEIGPVVKSVFFEHTTLNSLAEYLLEMHEVGLAKLFEHTEVESGNHATQQTESNEPAVAENASQLMAACCDYLAQMVADETKHARSKIQPDSQFEAFGIDSFLSMRMTKKLEKAIGSVDKAAFFEYSTVVQLATYLISHFPAELNQLFDLNDEPPKTSPIEPSNDSSRTSAANLSKKNQLPKDQLRDKTIDFLAQMVAEETKNDRAQVTAKASFDDFGIDSFLAMRMTKKLEKAIGPISKTAFFEYQNIADFTDFLLQDHKSALGELLSDVDQPAEEPQTEIASSAVIKRPDHMVITEDDLVNQPEIQSIIDGLNEQYGKENKALARNAIAPLIFLSANKQALFNFNENEDVALAFTYVGPDEDLQPLADEFIDYCAEQGFQGNMLLESVLKSTDERPYSCNAFGVMQRLTDINSLTLKGSKMRRLRYQISKFKSSGECSFIEYNNGDDPNTDQAITAMIDNWAANKNMVNPYIWTVKDQIAKGQLPKEHRVFLTHINEQLQNVIVITKLTSENGYLMDLEFYSEDMPLGGLEYGIWHILQQLKTEGHEVFSMGATFGVISEQDSLTDPKVYSILEGLQQQGAFNGEGNLQFKNKFRPINNTLYLCRPLNDDPEKVVDVIMMIANPYTQEPASVAVKK